MAEHSRAGRARRLIGAVSLALVVVAGPAAGSASAADLKSFSGTGTGFALRVIFDLSGLPSGVKTQIQQAYAPLAAASNGQLPSTFPFVIDQRFIESLAELGTSSTARAMLGGGFQDFEQVAEVTQTGEKTVTTAARKLPTNGLPLIDVTAGELKASITDAPKVVGDAHLSRVSVGLEALSSLLPPELTSALDDVVVQVNGAIDTVNGTLDGTLDDVATDLVDTVTEDALLGDLLDEAGLGDAVDDATELTTELQNAIQLPQLGNLLDGNIASISGLESETVSQKTQDQQVVSEATSKIFSTNVLNLVKTGAIQLGSRSVAAGTEGSADNDAECDIADVQVGGDNGVSLDGENIYVNGTAIPVPEQVGALKGLVDDVLGAAGISVELCDAAEAQADKDGTAAAQRVSAFRIEVAPKAVADIAPLGINAGDELFKIVVDPTVETSVAAELAVPTSAEGEPQLPRTGAGTIATVLGGIGLAAVALIARRRMHRA